MTGQKARQWQGVAALLGITFGALPLVQVLFGGRPGLWRLAIGDDAGILVWVLPLIVTVLAVVAIAKFELDQRGT